MISRRSQCAAMYTIPIGRTLRGSHMAPCRVLRIYSSGRGFYSMDFSDSTMSILASFGIIANMTMTEKTSVRPNE